MMGHRRLSAVWVLLAAAAAAELYDQPAGLDDIYQDPNNLDTGPFRGPHVADTDPTRLKELLLFRLIRSRLRERDNEHRIPRDLSRSLVWSDAASTLGKRFAQSVGMRPQQRWKTKKGKVIGSQMVCYFKLCAFRNPS